MEYTIKIIRSNRKSIGFEIKEPGILTVRAPYGLPKSEIQKVVEKHEDWIEKHMDMFSKRVAQKDSLPKYTREDVEDMAQKAMELIPPKVLQYAHQMGVTYGRITIRNQKTRWGSCSAKGNLNFNCLLTQVPESVLDYVIVHELCHRIEMNHSKKFWNLVEKTMPDYKVHKQWLKEHGAELIGRMI
jgi:hypothetical protein